MPSIRPIHYRKLAKIFELAGFVQSREEGSHMIFTKVGILRPVIIPKYKQVPVFIVKNNLRAAQLSRADYFSLLQKI